MIHDACERVSSAARRQRHAHRRRANAAAVAAVYATQPEKTMRYPAMERVLRHARLRGQRRLSQRRQTLERTCTSERRRARRRLDDGDKHSAALGFDGSARRARFDDVDEDATSPSSPSSLAPLAKSPLLSRAGKCSAAAFAFLPAVHFRDTRTIIIASCCCCC